MKTKQILQILGVIVLVVAAYLIGLQGTTTPANGPVNVAGQDMKDAIKDSVRDILTQEPGLIIEAFQNYRDRQQEEARQAVEKNVAPFMEAIQSGKLQTEFGNPDGDVLIVEFFDYQCGYCKRAFEDLLAVVEADGNVRAVLYEYPILGPVSRQAAQFALASAKQGKYFEYHTALMRHEGRLSEEVMLKLAGDLGLDLEQLKADAKSEATKEELDAHIQSAGLLNITGTPAFVIGNEVVPGALSQSRLKDLIASARSGS